MSTPNRTARKTAAIDKVASKARGAKTTKPKTASSFAGKGAMLPVKPVAPKPVAGKKGPVYEVPKQPRRRTVKK